MPLTLPGETVTGQRVGSHAVLDQVVVASPDRVTPPCLHFGACGGCSLQHWHSDAAAAWKASRLADALQRAGFEHVVPEKLARTPPGSRRRVDLALRREGGGFRVGLHARRSGTVVDLAACAVLDPVLVALLPPVRALLPRLNAVRRAGSAVINRLDSGPDVLLRTDAPITAADRSRLADFARAEQVCRISHAIGSEAPETACQLQPARISLSGTSVSPPPGAFLQASPAGEAAIVAAVLAGLPAKGRIAELYAGCGTLSFALARHGRVTAWEGDAAALAALRGAGCPMIEAHGRDLARAPLQAAELKGFATIVLDPPWHGAAAQMPPIAAAGAARVIYVSCNPAALARDAAVLHAAGYHVIAATPIDQFLWSARVEGVVVFGKEGKKALPVIPTAADTDL